LKAWLRSQGFNIKKIRGLSHNLTKLYKTAKQNGLVFEEAVQVNRWAARNAELHLTETGVITELERVNNISAYRRNREYWRHVWLLGKLHGPPYILRYHRSGS
jgi:hypothetical protein